MAKQLIYDAEAREKLRAGVDKLANAVKITLGPKGRNVVIDKKFGSPTVTNDGVTIAKEIDLEDPFENLGAQMVKEVATKTHDVAGDGTTTATILAQKIIHLGIRNVTAGANPMALKRGIQKAVEVVVEEVKQEVEADQDPRRDLQRRDDQRQQRPGDRKPHRRRDGKGRQGRRDHGRRGEGHGHDARSRRRDAVRPRLRVAVLRHRSPSGWSASSKTRRSSSTTRKISSMKDLLPILEKVAQIGPSAARHRRGHRGRGSRDPRREQAPRDAQGRRGEGPGIRRPPQGDAR